MKKLSSRKVIYQFSAKNPPAYVVKNGERVLVQTKDAFGSKLKSDKSVFEDIELDTVNPATGPIMVDGLHAGDVICVSIERIVCGSKGVIVVSPDLGNLSDMVRRTKVRIVEVKGKKIRIDGDLWIDANPHVGVVGVSPATGEYPTYFPGDFGGNLDTRELGSGAKVYLPTFVDGGMVALGDVHAAMGDGEVCGCGVEVSAELTIRLSRCEWLQLSRPMIETPTHWITYAAAETLDKASKIATEDMVRFIMNSKGMNFEDAYMIASAAANLGISQVVDPLVAAKMAIPKRYL